MENYQEINLLMSKIHDLNKFGISSPVKLIGEIKILRCEEGIPTIFLFDEHHGNLNNCIDKNILNAKELIKNGNVGLVGVESLAGGKAWDPENQVYSEHYFDKKLDDTFIKTYKSDSPQFANEISKVLANGVCGVECWAMTHRIQKDSLAEKYLGAADNPLNIKRSEHFIKTLFANYNTTIGNLILNCGSHHNDHIEEWISTKTIDSLIGLKANYIRTNTFS